LQPNWRPSARKKSIEEMHLRLKAAMKIRKRGDKKGGEPIRRGEKNRTRGEESTLLCRGAYWEGHMPERKKNSERKRQISLGYIMS